MDKYNFSIEETINDGFILTLHCEGKKEMKFSYENIWSLISGIGDILRYHFGEYQDKTIEELKKTLKSSI